MPRRALPYLATPRQASLYERICHGGRHLITSCKVTGRHGPGRGRRFFAHFAWAGALGQQQTSPASAEQRRNPQRQPHPSAATRRGHSPYPATHAGKPPAPSPARRHQTHHPNPCPPPTTATSLIAFTCDILLVRGRMVLGRMVLGRRPRRLRAPATRGTEAAGGESSCVSHLHHRLR